MLLHNRSRKEYVWYPDDPLENCLAFLCPDTAHTQNHSTEAWVSRPADGPELTGYGEVPPEPGLGLRLHTLSRSRLCPIIGPRVEQRPNPSV